MTTPEDNPTNQKIQDCAKEICTLGAELLSRFYGDRVPKIALEIAQRYAETQRYYHGPSHLLELLRKISASYHGILLEKLFVTALFHDAVYLPLPLPHPLETRKSNEEKSADLFLASNPKTERKWLISEIQTAINQTNWLESQITTETGHYFFPLDCSLLCSDGATAQERMDYECKIFSEHQHFGLSTYKTCRLAFLERWIASRPNQSAGAKAQREFIKEGVFSPKIAIYIDNFGEGGPPLTKDQLSVLQMARAHVDKVIVLPVDKEQTNIPKDIPKLKEILVFHQVLESVYEEELNQKEETTSDEVADAKFLIVHANSKAAKIPKLRGRKPDKTEDMLEIWLTPERRKENHSAITSSAQAYGIIS